MKWITVFCGLSTGTENIYCEKAFQSGRNLAETNIQLVYGGTKVSLTCAVADGVPENNGF